MTGDTCAKCCSVRLLIILILLMADDGRCEPWDGSDVKFMKLRNSKICYSRALQVLKSKSQFSFKI